MTSRNNVQQLTLAQALEANERLTQKVSDLTLLTRHMSEAASSYENMIGVGVSQAIYTAGQALESEAADLLVYDKAISNVTLTETTAKAVRVKLIYDVSEKALFVQNGFGNLKDWLSQSHTKNGTLAGGLHYEYVYVTQVIPALQLAFPNKEAISFIHHNAISFVGQPTAVSNEVKKNEREYDFLITGKRGDKVTRMQVPEILLAVLDINNVRLYLDEGFTEQEYAEELVKLWGYIVRDEDFDGSSITHVERFKALVALYKKIFHTKIKEIEDSKAKQDQDMLSEKGQIIWLGTTYTKNGHALAFIPTTIDAKVMELFTQAGIQIVHPHGVGTILKEADYNAIKEIETVLNGGYIQE